MAYEISRPSTALKGITTTDATPELERRQDSFGQRESSDYFIASIQTVTVGLETRIARDDLPRH